MLIFIIAFFKKKGKKATYFLLSLFIIAVPLLSVLYIILSLVFYYYKKKARVDISDVSFRTDREELIVPPNREVEINYVPIEDAIAVSDKKSLRKLILDTMLKGDKNTLSSLSTAINSNDSETSHYVASLLMEFLSNAKNKIQDLYDRLNKNKEDVELNLETFDYIYEIINMNIMSQIEKRSYVYLLNDVANTLYENNLWYLGASHYLKLVDLFISIEDIDTARKWKERANEFRKEDIETYKANLHFYYWQNDNEAFLKTINILKDSNIKIDDEILNLFRMY